MFNERTFLVHPCSFPVYLCSNISFLSIGTSRRIVPVTAVLFLLTVLGICISGWATLKNDQVDCLGLYMVFLMCFKDEIVNMYPLLEMHLYFNAFSNTTP